MKQSALAALLAVGALAWGGPQDPPKPPPAPVPAPAPPPAPAAPDPGALRANAVRPPSPLEGVYELRTRTIDGRREDGRARGYVAITRRHLLLCLVAPGPDPDLPLLRAGVRTWQADRDDLVRTEAKLGFFTDADGGVHVDPPGTAEIKRIEVARGLVRIWQDERSHLEFERIE
ncbi:MAG: hypothetical protein FJ265_11540 [Planctomycetes bacterium]|nr:hypothetical protein [Planctomycetota bacterium]